MTSIGILPILVAFVITTLQLTATADDTDGGPLCRMEIRYHSSFDTCTSPNPIAVAVVYADGKCHTVETDVDPSDEMYSLLPGTYRLECNKDNTLIFRDSACMSGTCAQGAMCQRDESVLGSVFASETGQVVQDPSNTDSYYCETLYDESTSAFFAVFGDCSQPGCSINGSINPGLPSAPQMSNPTALPISNPTTRPISNPTTQPNVPTRSPIIPTNSPVRTPIQSETPSSNPIALSQNPVQAPTTAATNSPITLAPVSTTLSPIIATPTTNVPITSAPAVPTASPAELPTAPSATEAPSISPSPDPTKSPVRTPSKTTQPSTGTITQESSEGNSIVLLAAIGGSITALVFIVLLFFVRKHYSQSNSVSSKNGALATASTGSNKTNEQQLKFGQSNINAQLGVTATNEIWFDPNRDDVSTLDGGTLPDMILGTGGDEPTASVNNDFDYNKNRYRSSATGADEQSRFTSSTNPTAFTSFSKLGIRNAPSSLYNDDDQTFEQQFADMDDEEIMTVVGSMNWTARSRINNNYGGSAIMNDIANRVQPFEVMVPPGMLGLVIDTPNGSVPVIKAIKPTSVLYPKVQVGDRLISVNQQNVTNMSSLEVSRLITQKQHQERVFVFCRLNLPS